MAVAVVRGAMSRARRSAISGSPLRADGKRRPSGRRARCLSATPSTPRGREESDASTTTPMRNNKPPPVSEERPWNHRRGSGGGAVEQPVISEEAVTQLLDGRTHERESGRGAAAVRQLRAAGRRLHLRPDIARTRTVPVAAATQPVNLAAVAPGYLHSHCEPPRRPRR